MAPFAVDAEKLTEELQTFQVRLAQGLENVQQMAALPSGVTAHEVVLTQGKLRLLKYDAPSSVSAPLNPTPLLIVYALVNRPYITDLQEDRSMIRGLLESGQTVYLIDWGYPDRGDCALSLHDYINGMLDECVDELLQRHDVSQLNLLGICQGGVFSLCYSALYPEKIRNLVTMVTPVDFQAPGNMLGRWAKAVDVDLLVDTYSNVPGEMLNHLFMSLKPQRLMGQKYLKLVDIMDDQAALRNFMQMEKWIFDSPDQAGEAFRQFVKDFVQQNKLISGTVVIGGRVVDLQHITMPVLNIYAEQDHLVPPASSTVLGAHVGTDDFTELSFPGGHIGIYVSGKAQRMVPPAIGEWLRDRM